MTRAADETERVICANCCQQFPRCECSRPRRTAVSRDDPRVYVRARERIFADIAAECERRAASGRVPSAVFFGAVEGCPRADLVGGAAMLIAQIEALDRKAGGAT